MIGRVSARRHFVGYGPLLRWLTPPRQAGEDVIHRLTVNLSCAPEPMTDHASPTSSVHNLAAARLALVCLFGLIVVVGGTNSALADEPAAGVNPRVPWTSSRLVGSPEPPLEFTVERTFKNLPLRTPVYVMEEPG